MRLICMLSFKITPVCFNPRICKRCDVWLLKLLCRLVLVSIHASVKDATCPGITFYFLGKVSIHASVKDATSTGVSCIGFPTRFNPRICKRCDRRQKRAIAAQKVSIHASVKDATIALSVVL